MSTNFPGPLYRMGFVAFSGTIGNWWENPRISHMMKYTIGSGSNGKKVPILWKSLITNFPGFPHTMGFVSFSRTMGNWWKTHAFPIWWSIPWYGNRMGKNYPYYGKSMITNFPGSPHTMGFVAFSHVMGNGWENPSISHIMKFVNFFLWKSKNPCFF